MYHLHFQVRTMEAERTSETLVTTYKTTRRHDAEVTIRTQYCFPTEHKLWLRMRYNTVTAQPEGSTPLIPKKMFLNQFQLHNLHILKIHVNIIFPTPRSSNSIFSKRSHDQNPVSILCLQHTSHSPTYLTLLTTLGDLFKATQQDGSMKMAVFWVVAPCSLVEVYQRFRGDSSPWW
jgi:hypothetical protein